MYLPPDVLLLVAANTAPRWWLRSSNFSLGYHIHVT